MSTQQGRNFLVNSQEKSKDRIMVRLVIFIFILLFGTHLSTSQTDHCIQNLQQCQCKFQDKKYRLNCANIKSLDKLPVLELIPSARNRTFDLLDLNRNPLLKQIPAGAFQNVRVRAIQCRSCDGLIDISPTAFAGLEDILESLELDVKQENIVFPPWKAVNNLRALRSLVLQDFAITKLDDHTAFQNLTELSVLKLTNCQISSISRDVFQPIANLTKLILSNNKLQALPLSAIHLLTKLKELHVDHNKIPALLQSAFSSNMQLEQLNLLGNSIKTIENKWSDGIQNSLRILNLHTNKVNNVNLEKINNFRNLQELDLENNKISSISNNAFQGLPNLRLLKLGRNVISSITEVTFQNLNSVTDLELFRNHIVTIGAYSFRSMRNLNKLILYGQQNRKLNISNKAFVGANITVLDLSRSNVDFSVTWDTIKNLVNLETLTIEFSNIKIIPDFVFEKLTKLKSLKMGNNLIDTITQKTVYGLSDSLQTLSLEENRIQSISECVLRNFSNLRKLALQENPLVCDCRLQWLKLWVKNNMLPFLIQFLEWKCADKNKLFRNVIVDEFLCSNNYTKPSCGEVSPPTTTVTTTTTQPTTTALHLSLVYEETEASYENVTIAWTTSNTQFVKHYVITVTKAADDKLKKLSDPITNDKTNYTIRGLLQNTEYNVCLNVHFADGRPIKETCRKILTKFKPVIVKLYIDDKTRTSALLKWYVNDDTYVDYYNASYESLGRFHRKTSERKHRSDRQWLMSRLYEETRYEVCMIVHLKMRPAIHVKCIAFITSAAVISTTERSVSGHSKGVKIAIIVGGVVAGAILVTLIFVIVFICLRKQNTYDEKHVYVNDVTRQQYFSRTDQPHETYDSKRYRKNKNASSLNKNEIKHIRSVQTDENNLSRFSAGSYQFLNEDSRTPDSGGFVNPVAPQSNGNDRNSVYPFQVETHI